MILIPILGVIPCSFDDQNCVITEGGERVVESAMVYFSEIQGNWLILLGVIFNVFSMASYNAVGVAIAKHINSVARALCDVSRIVIVWGAGIIITLSLGDSDPRFRW